MGSVVSWWTSAGNSRAGSVVSWWTSAGTNRMGSIVSWWTSAGTNRMGSVVSWWTSAGNSRTGPADMLLPSHSFCPAWLIIDIHAFYLFFIGSRNDPRSELLAVSQCCLVVPFFVIFFSRVYISSQKGLVVVLSFKIHYVILYAVSCLTLTQLNWTSLLTCIMFN